MTRDKGRNRKTKEESNQTCVKCENTLKTSDSVKCNACASLFHMKKCCAGISRASFDENRGLAKNFICENCVEDSESVSSSENGDKLPTRTARAKRDTAEPMELILKKISSMEKKFEKEMSQFRSITDMFSGQIDDVTKLKKKVKTLEERIRTLETTTRQPEQPHREVIVSNVPPLENENTAKVAAAIFESPQAGLAPDDIQQATRFESTLQEKKRFYLKVRLSSYEAKGKAIKAARAAKASLKDLNLPRQTIQPYANEQSLPEDHLTAPIFVNEAVSKTTKTLLLLAIKHKKEKKLHTVWTYLDKVFARRTEKAKATVINSEAELEQLAN